MTTEIKLEDILKGWPDYYREPTPLILFQRITGARAPAIKKGPDPIFAEALSSSA